MSKRRLETILSKIELIQQVVDMFDGSITKSLQNDVYGKPAIMMHLVALAEQFDKLKNDNAFEILMQYDKEDLKGAYDIRNFIAHDYEGVNIAIIEMIIREKLPQLHKITKRLLESC